jgi:hypothetical protein
MNLPPGVRIIGVYNVCLCEDGDTLMVQLEANDGSTWGFSEQLSQRDVHMVSPGDGSQAALCS